MCVIVLVWLHEDKDEQTNNKHEGLPGVYQGFCAHVLWVEAKLFDEIRVSPVSFPLVANNVQSSVHVIVAVVGKKIVLNQFEKNV